jgi:hypothetical protein
MRAGAAPEPIFAQQSEAPRRVLAMLRVEPQPTPQKAADPQPADDQASPPAPEFPTPAAPAEPAAASAVIVPAPSANDPAATSVASFDRSE